MGGCRDPKEGPTPDDEEPHEGSCCFLHDFPPMPAPPTPPLSALTAAAAMGMMALPPAAAPPAASPTISPDDEEQFPALTPSKPSASKPAAGAPAAAGPASGSTSSSGGGGTTSTSSSQPAPAKSFLQVALSVKKPSAASAGAGGGASATAAGAAGGVGGASSSASLSGSGSGGVRTVALKELVSRQKLANVWVMGGEEVRRQYQKARDEASRAAQARNRCFMRATEAFQRGMFVVSCDVCFVWCSGGLLVTPRRKCLRGLDRLTDLPTPPPPTHDTKQGTRPRPRRWGSKAAT